MNMLMDGTYLITAIVSALLAGTLVYIWMRLALRRQARSGEILQAEFKAASRQQLSIIRSLAGNFTGIYYVDLKTGQYDRFVRADVPLGLKATRHEDMDFFRMAVEWGRENLVDASLEQFLLTLEKTSLERTLALESEISLILLVRRGEDLAYHECRITHPGDEADPDKIIVAVYDIDTKHRAQLRQDEELARALEQKTALEKKAILLDLAARSDIMTGLFNRRAYADDLQVMGGKPDAANFVYVSMDIIGLKAINFDLGQDAGDELVTGAAQCMKQCFAPYGKLYRQGSDEFSAILHVDSVPLESLFARFEQVVAEWRGKLVSDLAVSFGYATAREAPGAPIEKLSRLAQQRMHEYRSRYYARKGIDRRAQQEAYEALLESYTRILRVNLKEDSFAIIKVKDWEQDGKVGLSDKFSEWVHLFARAERVHESDMGEFLLKTRPGYIRDFLARSRDNLSFRYKRETEEGFGETMLEMIPARDYDQERQIVFFYVKKVSGSDLYMRLQELRNNAELTVQMRWDHNVLEFQSVPVKKDEQGLYIRPYMREDRAIKFEILVTDKVRCNLFARDPKDGSRVMWHDVELSSVEGPEGLLYLVSTRDFNQYSRPGERRFHERTTTSVLAQVSDNDSTTAEVALHDISDNGLSFTAPRPLDFSSEIISITFADTINDEHFHINTRARVVNSYSGQGKFFYGCSLLDPPMDYKFYAFMRKLSMRQN